MRLNLPDGVANAPKPYLVSTIANADQIVVLDEGRVVERGTHSTLIAKGGLYADLWKRQAEEPRDTIAAE